MRNKGPADVFAERGSLAELANRQHGVVSASQLTGKLGYSRSGIHRAVAAGRLHRLHRGVFAVGHTNISQQGRCLAAVFASGPGSLLSHVSAAWLWDLAKVSPLPASVTTPIHRRLRPPIRLHEARFIADEDLASREGIPVTSVSRTLLDLAATVRFDWLEKLVERSEEKEVFDLRAVEDLLARTVGHHGHKRLRRAIALYKPTSFTRSGLEKRFLELVIQAGLPQPHTNYVEHGFELDCYWPEHRFVVELDVFETHGTRAAFERDRKRQEDLLLVGIAMTRVTGPRLEREPDEVIRRVARLLTDRERR
ncbi:MAG TPA: type IV toxin-antitoxin system AbiEi family antitoxin domain-containing protein [Solirubrobacterales bacterium]|nr:type IV toxin-antitoxin system AbiEi family antitoxin domain-containing protein [Solirubrobacterales bacterium]